MDLLTYALLVSGLAFVALASLCFLWLTAKRAVAYAESEEAKAAEYLKMFHDERRLREEAEHTIVVLERLLKD